MIAASDFVGYLLSAGGVVSAFLLAAAWVASSPASRRARRMMLVTAVAFSACSVYGAQSLIARALAGSLKPFSAPDATPGRRTAVVVLGSGSVDVADWSGGRFSVVDRDAARRVLEAARVFALVNPAFVISSGGNPHPARRMAASGETMRDALVSIGVPGDRIIVETVSKTTRDEVVVIAPILAAHSVNQVILVTSQVHMPRALGAFRAAGISAIPAIAREFDRDFSFTRTWLPSEDGLWVASSNAHELVGVAYYWLRGWWRR